jgi:hypothetical protein
MEYFKNPSPFLISCECGNRRDSRAAIYINLHKKATVMCIVSLRKYYKMAPTSNHIFASKYKAMAAKESNITDGSFCTNRC